MTDEQQRAVRYHARADFAHTIAMRATRPADVTRYTVLAEYWRGMAARSLGRADVADER
jgi:hypothetical protein